MKIILFLLSFFTVISYSQVNTYLKINHQLGSNTFALSTSFNNDLGETINITRLEYYISEISITHDGGIITDIPNHHVLVDASTSTYDSLGSFNITSVEKISIAIGVPSSVNHLDPATYPATHPLAPKSPSMHWGWSAGYRFVALEGYAGVSSPDYNYQIHGLGDVNYFKFSFVTSGTTDTNGLVLELNANYIEALRAISVSNGSFSHGETGKAKVCIENFMNHVFTSREGNNAVGIEKVNLSDKIKIYPNPANSSEGINISIEDDLTNFTLQLINAEGKLIINQEISNQHQVNQLPNGMYWLNIIGDKGILFSRKITVN